MCTLVYNFYMWHTYNFWRVKVFCRCSWICEITPPTQFSMQFWVCLKQQTCPCSQRVQFVWSMTWNRDHSSSGSNKHVHVSIEYSLCCPWHGTGITVHQIPAYCRNTCILQKITLLRAINQGLDESRSSLPIIWGILSSACKAPIIETNFREWLSDGIGPHRLINTKHKSLARVEGSVLCELHFMFYHRMCCSFVNAQVWQPEAVAQKCF